VAVPVPDEPPVAEVDQQVSGAEALRHLQTTLGRGDVDEMILQITGKRPAPRPPVAEVVAPPPASPIVEALLAGEPTAAVDSDTPADQALAGAAAEFQDVPPPRRMPLTPLERAAHHLGFKRVMWRVAAGVGLLLAGFAAYSFWQVFGTDIGDPPPLPVPGAQLFVDKSGKGWAIPDGAEASPQPSGRVYYYYKAKEVGAPDGEEVLAAPVDNQYVKERVKYDRAAANQAEIRGHYAVFGLMFSVVGLVMLLLGFWMYHDVRTIQLATEATQPPAEGQGPGEGAAGEPKDAPADPRPE
jgi:hypothetical protein